MLVFMLESRFKSLQLMTMYLGCESVVVVIAKYDENLLLPLLIEAKLLTPNKAGKARCFHS